MGDDPDRAYNYGILYVLRPARAAVVEGLAALRAIETFLDLPQKDAAEELSLGKTDGVIDFEQDFINSTSDD
jgi:hypothetical protein